MAQDMTTKALMEYIKTLGSGGGGTDPTIGQVYTASWTATSSNANMQRVSDTITLPAGTYIFNVKIPVVSQNSVAFCVEPFGIDVGGWFGAGQVVQTYIYTVSQPTTCYIATSMSSATNYTYIERGYLKAIRIA